VKNNSVNKDVIDVNTIVEIEKEKEGKRKERKKKVVEMRNPLVTLFLILIHH